MAKKSKKGWIFLALFAVLIIAGIIGKRIFDHPDLVIFFHLPGAVFLVMAWHDLSREQRARYRKQIQAFTGFRRSPDELAALRKSDSRFPELGKH